nr:hypothetical protein [Tanacetum cinerariifolium]
MDLPDEDDTDKNGIIVKNGNLESAELYVHVKPALGGTFTDIVMWIFCPFNGPVTFTIEFLNVNIEMNRVGEHVGDWEHYTLRIIAAEYLNGVVDEPDWLQYMREWGPTVLYDARSELEKIISHLPFFIRLTVETLFDLFPIELYGEEGPTGPKEKDNWPHQDVIPFH